MPARAKNQLAMDEQMVQDAALEQALEDRQKAWESKQAVVKRFDEAHELAMAEIEKLELPEGGIVRVGRFRITRDAVPPAVVSFERKAASRVTIAPSED